MGLDCVAVALVVMSVVVVGMAGGDAAAGGGVGCDTPLVPNGASKVASKAEKGAEGAGAGDAEGGRDVARADVSA